MYTIDCGTSFLKAALVGKMNGQLEKSERGSYLEEITSIVDMKNIESTDMPLKVDSASTNL